MELRGFFLLLNRPQIMELRGFFNYLIKDNDIYNRIFTRNELKSKSTMQDQSIRDGLVFSDLATSTSLTTNLSLFSMDIFPPSINLFIESYDETTHVLKESIERVILGGSTR